MNPAASATSAEAGSVLFAAKLPTGLPSIVGRERELRLLQDLLDGADRWVTLTGPGGVGKTRIAVEVATRADRPVLFVGLSALTDPTAVLAEVVRVAGWDAAQASSAMGVIRHAVAERACLVVLDTAEHLPGLAVELEAVLDACPALCVLVTSRVPLRAAGERLVEIDPLPVLGRQGHVPLSQARENESVTLLMQGVRRAGGTLEVTEANLHAVLQICTRLDGLPLAIELAAARLRLVSVERLAALLDRPLAVLGGRAAADAHRTMRATIDWSVRLLDPVERERFTALGVFPGSFDLAGAAAVLGLDDVELLDSFDALLDHHLVRAAVVGHPNDPRFELLDTLREYATERLVATGADTPLRWALARWCAGLADDADGRVAGPHSADALDCLEREYASVHGVLGWLADRATGDAEAGELLWRLCGSLWQFWSLRGRVAEGAAWIDRATAAAEGRASRALARAWYAGGQLAEQRGEMAAAEDYFTKAAELSEALGDDVAAAEAWNGIGMVARTLGDPERARAHHERAHQVFVAFGLGRQEATTLHHLAAIAYFSGDLPTAARLWTDTVSLLREVGDERARGVIVANLGSVRVVLGDLTGAAAAFEEGIDIAERCGDRYGALTALVNSIDVRILSGRLAGLDDRIGRARRLAIETDSRYALATLDRHEGRRAARQGRLGDAAALLAGSWRHVVEAEITTEQASSLEYLGMLAAEVGDHAAASTFLKAAAGIRRHQISDPLGPDAAALAHWTELVERKLGRPLTVGLESGTGPADVSSLSAAIEVFVLACRGLTRETRTRLEAVSVQRYGLTTREAEVAELLLERRTDQEIADALVISRRTVTTHVSAILRKLGVSSRREVATVLLTGDGARST